MAKVKKKDYEKLSDANIRHVISLLEPEDGKPITKKAACEILNISYNTTRLNKIIQEFQEREAYVASRKKANRGKKASEMEIQSVISDYISGENISEIAKSLFRSPGFVKGIIERVGVPAKPVGATYTGVALLPDQCVKTEFMVGQRVWSAKYHAPAIVKQVYDDPKYTDKYGADAYQIYVLESVDASGSYFEHITAGGFNAVSLAYDIGSLEHLEEYGYDS